MAAKAPAKAAAKKVAPKVPEADATAQKFTWKPKDGSPEIVLPDAMAAVSKTKTLRFFYQMHKRKGSLVDQVTYIMASAGVSERVQDQIFDLDDDEVMELVGAWTKQLTGGSPGES